MKRLVVKSQAGSLYYNDTQKGVKLEPHEITPHQRRLLLERLYTYEDTELTPEQIRELAKTNCAVIYLTEQLANPQKFHQAQAASLLGDGQRRGRVGEVGKVGGAELGGEGEGVVGFVQGLLHQGRIGIGLDGQGFFPGGVAAGAVRQPG